MGEVTVKVNVERYGEEGVWMVEKWRQEERTNGNGNGKEGRREDGVQTSEMFGDRRLVEVNMRPNGVGSRKVTEEEEKNTTNMPTRPYKP